MSLRKDDFIPNPKKLERATRKARKRSKKKKLKRLSSILLAMTMMPSYVSASQMDLRNSLEAYMSKNSLKTEDLPSPLLQRVRDCLSDQSAVGRVARITG